MEGSLLSRYATKAMFTTAAKTAMRGTLDAAKRAVPRSNNIVFYTRQGYLIRNPDPKGSFQCAIPIRHIFGFVDDYSKVTYGMRDTLQLIRKDDNDALFRTAAAGAGKVILSKLAWSVSIVQPKDVRKVNLYKSIAANNVIPASFRMRQCETFSLPQARSTVWRLGVRSVPEKPRWVLIRLQTNKSSNQETNAAVFLWICLQISPRSSMRVYTSRFTILLTDTMGLIIYWLVMQ